MHPGWLHGCRQMPGYRVDKGNDYLQGRFDGTVLDGLSWGYGALTGHDRLAAAAACTRPEILQQLRGLEVSRQASFPDHDLELCASASILDMCPCPPFWRQSSMGKFETETTAEFFIFVQSQQPILKTA